MAWRITAVAIYSAGSAAPHIGAGVSDREAMAETASGTGWYDMLASPRSARVVLTIFLAASLAIRLWHLGSVPTVFFHDECDNTINAIQILHGKGPGIFGLDWKPQPALAVHLIALSLRLVGHSVAAIRLPSALLSVAALIPFFMLARRITGSVPALLAALLLAFNLSYLHFSRNGWENVQICFYSLLAMEAVTRAEEGSSQLWWVIAGLAATLGAYVYFAGRAIIGALLLYSPLVLMHAKGRRARAMVGLGLMMLTFVLAVAPLYPTLRQNWNHFNQRTRAVLITAELPPNAGYSEVAEKALDNGVRGIQTYFRGIVNNEPRYSPVGRPLLDWLGNSLLLVGLITSLGRLRLTALWWLFFIVPFVVTQMLTTGAPNLARGIAMLPIVYLFAALGMWKFEALLGRWRRIPQAAFAVLVLISARTNVSEYFDWATSGDLAFPLQPAIELRDFDAWWAFQNQAVDEGRGCVNVGQWLAEHASPPPESVDIVDAAVPPPDEHAPRPRSGTVYRGSTTGQPYELDLGTIALHGGILEVEVFAVPGSDGVYDYLEVTGGDGKKVRVEAEDRRFTFGDRPVPVHLPDNHWWLQSYGSFSNGKGLVAMKSEDPPPLITRLRLGAGSYQVHVGSFTGDPGNGIFALQVNMHEVSEPTTTHR